MDFMKCKLCREPFFSYGSRLCPACQEQIDKDFVTVRDYIYDNPQKASVDQIAAATGVNEKNIMYLLEENRLTATGALAAAAGLRCQVCGRAISAGVMCESCKLALTRELGSAAEAIDNKKASRTASTTLRSSEMFSEYGKKDK